MFPANNKTQNAYIVATLALVSALVLTISTGCTEAKLLMRSRIYNDQPGGMYDNGPYGMQPGATGERALITVRGARHPYDGSAPNKMIIEDQPYRRGPYPRGVYDRLDMGYGRMPMSSMMGPMMDYGYPYRAPGGRYGQMNDAPSRIAVTGAFPYGYGSRFMP